MKYNVNPVHLTLRNPIFTEGSENESDIFNTYTIYLIALRIKYKLESLKGMHDTESILSSYRLDESCIDSITKEKPSRIFMQSYQIASFILLALDLDVITITNLDVSSYIKKPVNPHGSADKKNMVRRINVLHTKLISFQINN